MSIVIHARGFRLTPGLRQHVERRISFALGWVKARRILVRLYDINGPRGGIDKRCQIQVTASDGAGLIVRDGDADLYVAVDRAAGRAKRSLARQIKHRRAHSHYLNDGNKIYRNGRQCMKNDGRDSY